MREQFDSELERIKEISKYDKNRASSMLDDMGTAYISAPEYGHLDKSLISVRVARKALRAQGFLKSEIDDYLLERSYITKTQLKNLRADSIFLNDSIDIKPAVMRITDKPDTLPVTDLIINELHNRPKLLKALEKGISTQALNRYYAVNNATELKRFYEKHKDII